MTAQPFLSRFERFGEVDSTQRIVRDWMEQATPEVAVAVADHQTAGRGRLGRTWQAPHGAALLLSIGFRPARLALHHGWRLAATAALAMLDAAEAAAGLRDGTLWLKWPNDIVALHGAELRKVAGVLGESVADGEGITFAVVGIGVNADWARPDFPPELAATMTSLRELAGGRPVDRDALLEEFLARLEPRYEALQASSFDAAAWSTRQVTTGREVEVDLGDRVVAGMSVGVDPTGGALLMKSGASQIAIDAGEVVRCRLAG